MSITDWIANTLIGWSYNYVFDILLVLVVVVIVAYEFAVWILERL